MPCFNLADGIPIFDGSDRLALFHSVGTKIAVQQPNSFQVEVIEKWAKLGTNQISE